MTDPISFSSLAALRPLVKPVGQLVSRWKAEHDVARSADVPDLIHQSLRETFDRLRGGQLDDSWWRRLLSNLGHLYVAPECLKHESVRQWLREPSVADAVVELAKHRLSGAASGTDAAARKQVAASYVASTGEGQAEAKEAVDLIVVVLIAGFLAGLPADQKQIAALILATRPTSTEPDPVAQKVHSELAQRTLEKLLARRALPVVEPHRETLELLERVTSGDLSAADAQTRSRVQYWAAFFCAGHTGSLDTAKSLRQSLDMDDVGSLAVLDARITEAEGDSDSALRRLRDIRSATGRSALFAMTARVHGNRSALSWFEMHDPGDSVEFFTALGWRNWAIAMAQAGRWDETAGRLATLGTLRYADAGLAQVEGSVNAALLLPSDFRSMVLEDVPLYRGIALHRTDGAAGHHASATSCFLSLRDQLADVANPGFTRYLEWWRIWLRLMNPDTGAAQEARVDVAEEMTKGSRGVLLAPVAWAFELDFDSGPLDAWLDSRQELGGLNQDERLAELISNHQSMAPDKFLAYTSRNRAALEAVTFSATLDGLEFEACVKTGQRERARLLVEKAVGTMGEGPRTLLLSRLESSPGIDPRTALESAYANDDSLGNLKALVDHVRISGDFTGLRKLSLELFACERTAENAGLVAFAHDQMMVGSSLEFLESVPEIVAASDELQAHKAEALFLHGRFQEASAMNRVLLAKRTSLRDTSLEIFLALNMGQWEQMASVVDREWERRDEHDAQTLLQLAYLAAESGVSEARALEFSQLAAERGTDDPNVLWGTYLLHVQLDQEDRADPTWLRRAESKSSDFGPVQAVSLNTFVRDVLPRRRAAAEELSRHVAIGKLPMSCVAGHFNVPMLRIIIQQAEQNQSTADRRRVTSIPIVSGSRDAISIERDWTIAMDITSILVLDYLGLLEIALATLGHVALSPDIFAALFSEKRTARFHQPSQQRRARELRTHHDTGRIRCADTQPPRSAQLVSEVGPQLATLLAEAQVNGGAVLCDRPIYRVDSLLRQEASIGELQKLLLSPLEFCDALGRTGRLRHEDVNKARELLPRRPWRPEAEPVLLPLGPIYLDGVALHYLQDAGLLGGIAASGVDLRIHEEVLTEACRLIATSEHANQTASRVDTIRAVLRGAIARGRASMLPRKQLASVPAGGEIGAWASTESLLRDSTGYNAVCIDDRALNRGGVADAAGRLVPTLSVLDILRELLCRSVLTWEKYLEALHRLRDSGFVFVLPDAEELYTRWETGPDQERVGDSVELAAIRQMTARVSTAELCTPPEAVAISRGAVEAGAKNIRRLWLDSAVSVERAEILSNQMWRHLLWTPWAGQDTDPSSAAHGRRGRLALPLTLLLAPMVELANDRRADYSGWIRRIIAEIAPAKRKVVDEAVVRVWTAVQSIEKYAEVAGHAFLAQLPEDLRDVAIAGNPDFGRKCGFEPHGVLSLPNGPRLNVATLMAAGRTAFQTGEPFGMGDLSGREIEIVPLRQQASAEVRWVDATGSQNVEVEDLALLASANRTRTRAVRRLARKLGPTAPKIYGLLEEKRDRVLTDDEVAGVLSEAARGFMSVQAACRRVIQGQPRFGLSDIVPASVSYFEELSGPQPGPETPDEYVRNTLVPYRRLLLRRDLNKGLELALRGCLGDDLCPGRWLTRHRDSDRIWNALEAATRTRNPFVLIGALDVCLYRQADRRFGKLAEDMLDRLADPDMGLTGGQKYYRILHGLSWLVQNQVALLPDCGSRPNYWRRMAGLMHAGWLLDVMDLDQAETDGFLAWMEACRHLSGHYADAVGFRREPMLNAGMVTPDAVRDEVVSRLGLLRWRHERSGRRTAWSDSMDAAWRKNDESARNQLFGFPGPLEGHRRPVREMPDGFVDKVHGKLAEQSEMSRIRVLAVLSQGAKPSPSELEIARKLVEAVQPQVDDSDSLREINELNSASIIAAACRDQSLGDAVADALVRLSDSATREETVHQIVRLLVQTAAAHEDEALWSEWLDTRLVAVAEALPGPPSEALGAFLDSVRAMEMILPAEAWFHLRGRAVALSGAA